MKKWIARSVLMLIALALYGGIFWGLAFLFESEPLAAVLKIHVVVGGISGAAFILVWAFDNCEW